MDRQYKDIDQNIAENVRAVRETCGISQDELAQRMADRGFKFRQATIWKIESGQRPVRASELIALTDALGLRFLDLTRDPDATRYPIRLEHARVNAGAAYRAVKEAADAYLDAQMYLAFAARTAHDAGFTVTELHTSSLTTLPEEAVIEARVARQGDALAEENYSAVGKILDALRSNGYEPTSRIEDIEVCGGDFAVWTP